jgi:uncharacterized membrane protein
MDSQNIIAWNPENWITVILMVAVGFFGIGIVMKWWSGRQQSGSSGQTATVAVTQP